MARIGRDTEARYRGPRLGPNRTSVSELPAHVRLQEVASLLAAGFLRHWARQAWDEREEALDFQRTSSDSCARPSSEGEST